MLSAFALRQIVIQSHLDHVTGQVGKLILIMFNTFLPTRKLHVYLDVENNLERTNSLSIVILQHLKLIRKLFHLAH